MITTSADIRLQIYHIPEFLKGKESFEVFPLRNSKTIARQNLYQFFKFHSIPSDKWQFKIRNVDTKVRGHICSKLTIKTQQQDHLSDSGVICFLILNTFFSTLLIHFQPTFHFCTSWKHHLIFSRGIEVESR